MENREIKYQENWYKVGDVIKIRNRLPFLFWYLPITKQKEYVITFIGCDCAASIVNGFDNRTITGSVRNINSDVKL